MRLLHCFPFLLLGVSPCAPQDSKPADPREIEARRLLDEVTNSIRASRPAGARKEGEAPPGFDAWLAEAKSKFLDLAAKVPDTEASFHARTQVALIVAQGEGRIEESLPIFERLLADLRKSETRRDLRIQTAWIFANVLRDAERLGEARKRFEEIAAEAGDTPTGKAAGEALRALDKAERLRPGNAAIDFEATGFDGNALSLAAFRGRVLLLDFWATWSPPCRKEIPDRKEVRERFQEKGFEILGISLDREADLDRGAFERFRKEKGISWPQVFEGKGLESSLAGLYGIHTIPASFLLDRKGTIRYRDLRGAELRERVEELLGEEGGD